MAGSDDTLTTPHTHTHKCTHPHTHIRSCDLSCWQITGLGVWGYFRWGGHLVHKPPVDASTWHWGWYIPGQCPIVVCTFVCACACGKWGSAGGGWVGRDAAGQGGQGGGGGDRECLWQPNCWPLDTLLLLWAASPSHWCTNERQDRAGRRAQADTHITEGNGRKTQLLKKGHFIACDSKG